MISYHSFILTCLCHRWQEQHDVRTIIQTTIINLHLSLSLCFSLTLSFVRFFFCFILKTRSHSSYVFLLCRLNNRWNDTFRLMCKCLSVCACLCVFINNYRNECVSSQSLTHQDICINILSWLTQRTLMICLSSYIYIYMITKLTLKFSFISSFFVDLRNNLYPKFICWSYVRLSACVLQMNRKLKREFANNKTKKDESILLINEMMCWHDMIIKKTSLVYM